MAKNVVVCCDGTSNQYAWDKTNVVKLCYALVEDPAQQVAFYHPGVGTMGPPGALTKFDNLWTKLAGLAIGRGLSDDICDAYTFLMAQFTEGDRLFIFGFSRGAYTARCLASALHLYGLIRKGDEPLVRYAIAMMNKIGKMRGDIRGDLALADGFKATFSRICNPWFVGVWDTVDSVGWVANPLKLPFTADNPDIEFGRHAVSIDERRAFFRQNLWRPNLSRPNHGPKDLKQVWFPGSHSDVGGGYPERESAQSKYPLEWMISEAQGKGLLFAPSRVDEVLGKSSGSSYIAPSVNQPLHESLTWNWWPCEFVPKSHWDRATGKTRWFMNLGRRRKIPPQSFIHRSAYMRGAAYARFIPADGIPAP